MTFLPCAAPLTRGSATGPGVNPPGRRQEDDVNLVAFHMLQDPVSAENSTPAWGKGNKTGTASIGIATPDSAVRRLTPTECERLQSFPDGWTALGADSRRYAALGDAVTVNVSEWIGRRLMVAVEMEQAA